ncbi:hypothetical protein VT91_03810 [Clostridium sporogenes]|uniref:hypothetical protein n=1 Tax=Clostridium botulinum TaxID=1491 RepID=UPI0007178762|nr:hypothetical protein [Clostridium botulinum]KRU26764.1 hypothetical protein VT28_29890 [Clostridium sporogenes]KRU29628.1 hypothetical protein WG71_14730 [Clostridium sporogenes]KRU35393.1 hypothetical protein VT91_03810 [Clostridium sporogenes]KRU49619.1 hypothetical protein VT95_02860 [Clostridium sporogenes]MBZ1328485.1 hypothetical protein [Clostridium botulinum]
MANVNRKWNMSELLMLSSKKNQKLVTKINNLCGKSKQYKQTMEDIVTLPILNPKVYGIGTVENCTIYKTINGQRTPLVYLFFDGDKIIVRSEDQSGNVMGPQFYTICANFNIMCKMVKGKQPRKLYYFHIVTQQDAQDLYTAIVNV